MTDLPTGNLTFFFSDIEGSTRLLQVLGDRWHQVLDDHHRLLRAVVAEYGGTEVVAGGDSFFVVFPTAPAAVGAAASAQRALAAYSWPDGTEVRVRLGLHTGTASLAGGSYAGLDVHRAARIMSAGHGGQILLSDATRALSGSDLPHGVALRDLGEHRLKDLGAPEHLHQLTVDGLPTDFPPLRTLTRARNNLPIQLTTFLGRDRELEDIAELLERARLVTLTGPGGTGKTRLALQAAAGLIERFPDGAWFVPLAAISDPDLVAPTIAQVLEVGERSNGSPAGRIVEHLGNERVLLVLDNLEQVIQAAPVVTELLSRAPNVRILVTSRTVLRVSGEHEYPVPPLALPDLLRLPDMGGLTRNEAVALFIERARAAHPSFTVTSESAAAIAEICVRLDGLPLAIELAAARTRLLSARAIRDRLTDRLALLASGPRDVPERQRTLRGAIEWSHDLLDEPDRRLFACLAVFVGGCGLDAVEHVCRDGLEGSVLDALESLVEKSLVRGADGTGGEPRFEMLETIREFAAERLLASGHHGELKDRHADWFAGFAERAAAGIMGPDQRDVLDRLEHEQDNFRAAIAWAMETDRADTALRLTSRLWRMWQMRLYINEGRERTRLALAKPGSQAYPDLRADALEAAGGLAYWAGDVPAAKSWYEQALEARRALGDRRALAQALYNLAYAFGYVKPDVDPEDLVAARRLADEALTLFHELGDESGEARTLFMLATVDALTGDYKAMEEKSARAERVFRRLEDHFHLGWALWSTVFARIAMGRPEDARRTAREALGIFTATDDLSGSVGILAMAAMIASRTGDRERAARLSGAVARAEGESGIGAYLFPRAVLGFDPDSLRTAPETADAWDEGARMDLDAVIRYARDGL
jgi:predicted ATPase/class 3 adenylate cyclase